MTLRAPVFDTGELGYSWTQLAGPTLNFSDPGGAETTFIVPEISERTSARVHLEVREGEHPVWFSTFDVSLIPSQPATGQPPAGQPPGDQPPGHEPTDSLAGWWRFALTGGGGQCSVTAIGGTVWPPVSWLFRFDDQGALVEAQPLGKQNPNDPEELVLQWEDVQFSGSISDTGVSFHVSGHVFEPRWQTVAQLEQEQSYFDPLSTVGSLSADEKSELIQNVGCLWSYEMTFTTVPGAPRDGPAITNRTRQKTEALIVCDSGGCDISRFYQDPPEVSKDDRLFTTLIRDWTAHVTN